MNIYRKFLKWITIFISIILVSLILVYINHLVNLKKEEKYFKPLGKLVDVDGKKMSLYIEGQGDKTLVFMAGGGTSSPILDFKSLISQLSGKYKTIVIEKFGYGFSDVLDKERNIDSILADTRKALEMSGEKPPYILVPHSMSGLEALYWAQKYPEEISAIVGLDMAVPEYYDDFKINLNMVKLSSFFANIGLTRLIPNIAESEAIKYGSLSEREKDIYRLVFYRRTATETMIREVEAVKENAKRVREGKIPSLPILAFLSTGEGIGSFDRETWREKAKKYLGENRETSFIELDAPHYIHDHEYEKIGKEINNFLQSLK